MLGARRPAHVMIATILLALPASAVALSSASAAPRQPDATALGLPVNPGAVSIGNGLGVAGSAPTATVRSRLRLRAQAHAVLAGGALSLTGRLLPGAAGRTVSLQIRSDGGWRSVADARTGDAGGFRLQYTPVAAFGQRLRVVVRGDRAAASVIAPAGTVTVFEPEVASWYDDGANTACGFHAGLGVANKSLPCGTKVALRYGGRTVTAVVDDRGPFVPGRDWDLNQTTAAALGFGGVGTVWSSVAAA